jgi:hypothetical protein
VCSEICDRFLGICEFGDREVINVDCPAKKRINQVRSENLGCFEAHWIAFDRCKQIKVPCPGLLKNVAIFVFEVTVFMIGTRLQKIHSIVVSV